MSNCSHSISYSNYCEKSLLYSCCAISSQFNEKIYSQNTVQFYSRYILRIWLIICLLVRWNVMTQAVFMNTNHIFMRNKISFVIAYKISVKINVENVSYLNTIFLSELRNFFYLVVIRIIIKHFRKLDLCLIS